MLVLSRKISDSIVLPELDVAIEVLQVKGKTVRLGVNAPIEIKVLRGEIADSDDASEVFKSFSLSGEEHEIRNQLNTLNLAVSFAKKLMERGRYSEAADKVHAAIERLQGESRPVNAGSEKETVEQGSFAALLVEDMENEREMLAGFLRLHGYRVDTVPDGLAALDYLESNPKPDMIMFDIGMPRMNGAQLIRRIREIPALDQVKLFAISGESADSANVDVSKNRITKWFQKPLQPSDLVSEINREFRQLVPTAN